MKSNPFNICPTCFYRESCVLTTQKSQVWSCSEYEEGAIITKAQPIVKNIKKAKPKMETVSL